MQFDRVTRYFKPFLRHAGGATIIEFAIVAPIFFFLIFCLLELGLMLFSQIALESATMQVSRSASIGATGTGCDRACTIKKIIADKSAGLINGSKVVIEANTLSNGGVPRTPEICFNDPASLTCADGSFIDSNGNGKYDGPAGVTVGNPGDMVEIRVSYPWRMMIPFIDTFQYIGGSRTGKLFGPDGTVTLSATTVIKNEPF